MKRLVLRQPSPPATVTGTAPGAVLSIRTGTALEIPTYAADWDSEAYITASGQNSNNTVRIDDGFLDVADICTAEYQQACAQAGLQ